MRQDVNFPSQIKWFLKQQVQDFVWQKCTGQEKKKALYLLMLLLFHDDMCKSPHSMSWHFGSVCVEEEGEEL